jgi:hypothetical protein
MNYKMFFAAFMLLAASCSNESVEQSVEQPISGEQSLAPISVRVDGFTISQGDFPSTRATAVGSYSGVKFLTLAFYAGNGTEVYKAMQAKNEADFGEFSTFLPIGSYTMVVLGYVLYDDDELTLTSPTQAEYTGGCPRETFAATQVVNVTNTTAKELTATLDRIITCLQVVSTDGRTANVNKVRMSFAAGGKRFSPTSGLATVNTGSVSTVGNSATVGTTSTSKSFVFLATDEQTMNVTIETLDADGNPIFSKTVENVPFKRNRVTRLTGAMYGASATAGSFQVNTTWLDEEDPINF